jgi:nucleoside-diphosphate-sugar epimerase
MAGIYGPGRVPLQGRLRAGEPIAAPHGGWLNLIHADDAAAVVLAAEQRDLAGFPLVINVADGVPVPRGDYYREIARQLGAPEPRFAPPDPGAPKADRAAVSRRISVRRLQHVLGIDLRYPSYREGLAAILSDPREG